MHRDDELNRTISCCICNTNLSERFRWFLKSLHAILARIGNMNLIGRTPLPALSPHGGERVAEGRDRGGSWSGGMPGLLRDVRENQSALTHLQHSGQGCVAAGWERFTERVCFAVPRGQN